MMPSMPAAYRQVLKKEFPAFLQKIAQTNPHTLVFLNNSAVPFGYLTLKLWRELELPKRPNVRFLSPPSRALAPKNSYDSSSYKKKLGAWVEQNKLAGKRVTIIDDFPASGKTLEKMCLFLQEASPKNPVIVTKAAFAGEKEGIVTKATTLALPPWQSRIPLSRYRGEIHARGEPLDHQNSRFSEINKNYWRRLHAELSEIAREIAKEHAAHN